MTTPAKKPAAPRARAAAAKKVVAAKPVAAKAAPKASPATEAPKPYKMLTGIDDSEFCSKVSRHLAEGYELYGSPTMTFNGKNVIVGQAVVLKAKAKKAAKGKSKKK
jgi:hypothetical protein